jgi:hypothetical protein
MGSLEKTELKARAEAKRKHLEGRLAELKANAAKSGSETVEGIESKLDQINEAAKEGWDNLSDSTAEKLNSMLRD